MPAHWLLENGDFRLCLTEGVLLRPVDLAASCFFDAWSMPKHQKLLSVWWMPESPWEPPGMAIAKGGEWLDALGWSRR